MDGQGSQGIKSLLHAVKRRPLVSSLIALMLVLVVGLGFVLSQRLAPRSFISDGVRGTNDFYKEIAPEAAPSPTAPNYGLDYTAGTGSVKGELVNRKVIYNGHLLLEVDLAEEAQKLALQHIKDLNGFTTETSRSLGYNDRLEIRMVFRVPAASFDDALLGLGRLGKIKDESSQGDDITEQYVDLAARLGAKIRQEARYLEILNEAKSVDEILQVERELDRIRAEIESMEGTLRFYDDRTDLATITLVLREPAKITGVGFTLRDILSEISEAFLYNIRTVLVFMGAIVPWLLMLALVVGIVLFVRGKRKKTADK